MSQIGFILPKFRGENSNNILKKPTNQVLQAMVDDCYLPNSRMSYIHISPKENYAFIRYFLREDFQPLSKYTIPTVPVFGVVFVLKNEVDVGFGLPYQADMSHSTGAWWHWHGRNGVLEPKIQSVSHKVPSLWQVLFWCFFFEDGNIYFILYLWSMIYIIYLC